MSVTLQSFMKGYSTVTDLARLLGLVYVAAAADSDVVGQQLQRDDLDERREQFDGRRNVDDVLDQAADGRVALGGDGDDAAERAVTSWMLESVFS